MKKIRKKFSLIDIGDDARRQYIDAQSTFSAWEDAFKETLNVRGSMRWKNQNGADYLIRLHFVHDELIAGGCSLKNRLPLLN